MSHSPLYYEEYTRALQEHPPEEWAEMRESQMIEDLKREVEELKAALWGGDLDGPHGIEIESCHVEIVARRIREEMRRRYADEALPASEV